MSIDYGPLQELIGVWKGDKGMDVAPEPDGPDNNPYYETITFTPVQDEVENAESQNIVAVHYRQVVQKKRNDEVFHDETGYWMWDAEHKLVMHSLLIPRAVGVLAGGNYNGEKNKDGRIILEVAASEDSKDWNIIQSPFMRDNARTLSFTHKIIVGHGKLSYTETTMLDIYGNSFEHTDENELQRQ